MKSRRFLAGLVAVILWAVWVRWMMPGTVIFTLDEGTITQRALICGQFREVVLESVPSSTGLPTFPLPIWLQCPAYFVYPPNPIMGTLWIGLLGAAAVGVIYALVARYFGVGAGMIAGLVYGANPWAVLAVRHAWPQSTQPLLTALTVYAGALGFLEGRKRWQAAHMVLLALTFEVHFQAFALIPVTLYLPWVGRKRINWRWVMAGAFVAALTTIPFWITFTRTAGERRVWVPEPRREGPVAFTYFWRAATGDNVWAHANPRAAEGEPPRMEDSSAMQLFTGLGFSVSLMTVLVFLLINRHNRRGQFGIAVLIWLFAPLAAFALPILPVYEHYFDNIFGAVAAVIALFWVYVSEDVQNGGPDVDPDPIPSPVMWTAALIFTGFFAFIRVGELRAMLDYAANNATPHGVFGVPANIKKQVADSTLDLRRETGAEEIIVIKDGQDRTWGHEIPATFTVLLDPAPHRFIDGAGAVVLPARDAVYLVHPPNSAAMRWLGRREDAVEIPLRAGEEPFLLLHYDYVDRESTLEGFHAPEGPATFANGARFLGWRYEGGTLYLVWALAGGQVPRAAGGMDYHSTFYFYEDGELIAQSDGPILPSGAWRDGDIAITWRPFEWPEDAAGVPLYAAMYTWPGIERVMVVEDGAIVADAVPLGKAP
jgi:4-amino-4-deoxy-L-arabinose transferase-like glycosyltransferase